MQKQTTVSGICGEKLKWTLDDAGTLTISGTGRMYDFDYRDSYGKFFIGNDQIRQAVILPGVESIGKNAFDGCTSLRSIHIPRSVTNIQTYFYGCTGMTEIIADPNHPAYTSIDGSLYSKDGKTLLRCPCGREGTFNVPDGVTCIQSWALSRCIRLTAVTFPDSMVSIGDYALVGCERVTSVTVPESVTSIAMSAFAHCTSLTSVTLPRSLTSIVKCVFDGCSGLRSVTIPDGVQEIGEWVFRDCTSLSTIIIPGSVQSIGCEAFRGCTSLHSVILPNSLKRLGQSAFQNCGSLTSVTLPNGLTSIESWAFSGCTNLTSVIIPDSVTSFGSFVFDDCEQLTICGASGSSAEIYAVRHNIPFREVALPTQSPPCAAASGV